MADKKLKVLIVKVYAPDEQRSMIRYGNIIGNNKSDKNIEIEEIEPKSIFWKLSSNKKIKKFLSYIDKYVLFTPFLYIKSLKSDVVHIVDHSSSLYDLILSSKKVVITCHDLFGIRIMQNLEPGVRHGMLGNIMQKANVLALRRAGFVVCISPASAKELHALLGIDGNVTVIPNILDENFINVPNSPHAEDVREPYFLSVGGNQFYKNRVWIVKLFEHIANMKEYQGHRLKMVGKEPDSNLRQAIENSSAKERIDVLVDVLDDELAELYVHAQALIFTSLKEGFGWPIIEAQSCGCVVITSNLEPMSSIGGDAAILVDPTEDPEGAALKIHSGLKDSEELRQRGRNNVQKYLPEEIYRQYSSLYAKIANRPIG